MPRIIEPGLQALIDSGHCRWYDTVDLELVGEDPLHLSTGEFNINGNDYHAELTEVEPLSLGLNQQVDEVTFKVQNEDLVMGQTLTGATNMLNGATGMLGIVFENEDNPAERYYDPKMPGFVVTAEVTQEDVTFNLISEIDGAVVMGRSIVSVFPWREPIHRTPNITDPNDLNPPIGFLPNGLPIPGPGQIITTPDGTVVFNPGGGRSSRYPNGEP